LKRKDVCLYISDKNALLKSLFPYIFVMMHYWAIGWFTSGVQELSEKPFIKLC